MKAHILISLVALMISTSACGRGTTASVSTPVKKAEEKQNTLVTEARKYLGTPYKWGGNDNKGIDCSGLICNSYKAVGVVLPRTADAQANMGVKVDKNNLQVGDLIFFTDKKGNTKITHVGMVSKVNGANDVMFIHASSVKGVVEVQFFSDYYQNIFLKAVRIL